MFNERFEDLWRRFIIVNSGQTLFGLPVTDYPFIPKVKKEINMLQKLYGLYDAVMESIDGYFEIPWVEVDTEKINIEIQEFQNK